MVSVRSHYIILVGGGIIFHAGFILVTYLIGISEGIARYPTTWPNIGNTSIIEAIDADVDLFLHWLFIETAKFFLWLGLAILVFGGFVFAYDRLKNPLEDFVRQEKKVSVNWQAILGWIPVIDLLVFYRIKKLRFCIPLYLGVSGTAFVSDILLQITDETFLIIDLVASILVFAAVARKLSIDWNKNFI